MQTEQSNFKLSDGLELSVRHWHDGAGIPVLLVHGYGEHIGRYAHVAAHLVAGGFDVWGYDARGHGLSQGARGFMAADDTLVTDLMEMFDEMMRRTGQRPIVVAHSMGGLVAALAVATHGLKPAALVLSSPALRVRMNLFQKILINMGLLLFKNKPIESKAVDPAHVSHDAKIVADYRSDALNHAWISPRMARMMRDGGDVVRQHAHCFDMPTLLIYAGDDRVIDASGSDDFGVLLNRHAAATVRRYDSAYHEIFNESLALREEILNHMSTWMRQEAIK